MSMWSAFSWLSLGALLSALFGSKWDPEQGNWPTKKPVYTDSLLPVAVQILLHVLDRVEEYTVEQYAGILEAKNTTDHANDTDYDFGQFLTKQVTLPKKEKTLLNKLKDLLWLEANSGGITKKDGISDDLLDTLRSSHSANAKEQLTKVLTNILDLQQVKLLSTIFLVEVVLELLQHDGNQLSSTLTDIEPLVYDSPVPLSDSIFTSGKDD